MGPFGLLWKRRNLAKAEPMSKTSWRRVATGMARRKLETMAGNGGHHEHHNVGDNVNVQLRLKVQGSKVKC